MLRHRQDRAGDHEMASDKAAPVDTCAAAASPVDTTRRPRTMWYGADVLSDYFGNSPRATCGRGERQRRGMIMRENA